MKIVYMEMNEDELKANRGLMDAVVDAVSGLLNGVYGTCTPVMTEEAEEQEEGD